MNVLFDLDNTLFDHDGAARQAVLSAARVWAPEHGVSDDVLVAEWARLEILHFPAFIRGECGFVEQGSRRVRGFQEFLSQGGLSDEASERGFRQYLELYKQHWRAFPDVATTLTALESRGVRVAILTNGERAQQVRKLAALGLQEYPLFTPVDQGIPKPDRASYLTSCEQLGWDPSETLHVGDHVDIDARGSRDAGLTSYWLNRNGVASPFTPTDQIVEIRSLTELPK